MTDGEPAFLVVGHVSRAHGTKGEVFVEPLTDHPGDVFVPGVVLRQGDARGGAPDPDAPPLRVESVRPFKHGALVTFGGVGDRNESERLRGRYLLVERDRLPPLEAGEVFLHQLVGMEVVGANGTRVGEVIEVYELAPADLLEIRTDKG